MITVRSIFGSKRGAFAAAVVLACGCAEPKYGVERQLTFEHGAHPVWAVAPAVNLSGEPGVDPILQADLLFQQLQAVNNLTVIPVDRVVAVFAALHIDKVESPEQASLVCEQLGCDDLVIPTITIYDPYNPPKLAAALQLLPRVSSGVERPPQIDARELVRQATPTEQEQLPSPKSPTFVQVVGMYDSSNGSVHQAVYTYAAGRHDPVGPLGANEYFLVMDRYCGFVYHTLIGQLLDRVDVVPQPTTRPAPALAASNRPPTREQLTDGAE